MEDAPPKFGPRYHHFDPSAVSEARVAAEQSSLSTSIAVRKALHEQAAGAIRLAAVPPDEDVDPAARLLESLV